MDRNFLLSRAENYLHQMDQLIQELNYIREQLAERISKYRDNSRSIERVDLLSSLAYIEKYTLPLILSQQGEQRAIENPGNLVLGIDGLWDAYEFRQLFEGVDFLSKAFTIRYKLDRPSPDFRLRRGMTRSQVYRKANLGYYLSTMEELHVRQIQFASPGLVSFEGIGETIKEVRETFDYVITGVWVKHFLDTVYQIRDIEVRKAEEEARRADALARKAEAEARRAEADLRAIEARSRIKAAVRQLRQEDRSITNKEGMGLEKINELANLGIRLEAEGLANLHSYEDGVINSISMLHRLSYEQQKLKPNLPRNLD